MTHTYQLTGMTCSSCEYKVSYLLKNITGISEVKVSKDDHSAIITMDKHIEIAELQQALGGENSKYAISSIAAELPIDETKSWIETYKPILLIFGLISAVTLSIQFAKDSFDMMQWMQHFMAGFFLVFSFFKLLNLNGFAESYAMYDVIAKKFKFWGYIYAFLELGLGFSYLLNFQPFITNIVTFVVMSISIIGVLISVLNKQKIQCACLGDVFKLPMSTVTIIEDALMILMSAGMILLHY